MGVPTREVGYTSAMPRREDHEVRKGHVGHWIKKKKFRKIHLRKTAMVTCRWKHIHCCHTGHSRFDELLLYIFCSILLKRAAGSSIQVAPSSWHFLLAHVPPSEHYTLFTWISISAWLIEETNQVTAMESGSTVLHLQLQGNLISIYCLQ